jgi:hypothetical protein
MKTDGLTEYIGFVRADKEALQTKCRGIIQGNEVGGL